MSCSRRNIARLFKLGGAAGGFMAATSLIDTEMKKKICIPFSLLAKPIDKENVITNDLYHGTGIKWDSNWDHRFVHIMQCTKSNGLNCGHDDIVPLKILTNFNNFKISENPRALLNR